MVRQRGMMRVMVSGGMLGMALLLQGCADRADPVAPDAYPSSAVRQRPAASDRQAVSVLERTAPMADRAVASRVIGPRGGTIALPSAGLRVTFPAGAVSKPVRITVTALSGELVAYTFAPHGLEFALAVTVDQDLRGTAANANRRLQEQLAGGYFVDAREDLDAVADVALVSELLPATVDFAKNSVRFGVWHFSGYLLASGKTDTKVSP